MWVKARYYPSKDVLNFCRFCLQELHMTSRCPPQLLPYEPDGGSEARGSRNVVRRLLMTAQGFVEFGGTWGNVKILQVVESLKESQGIIRCKKWRFLCMSRGFGVHLSGTARHTYFIAGSTVKYCGIYVQGKDRPGMYTEAWCKQ